MIRKFESKDLIDAAKLLKKAFAQEPWNEDWSVKFAEDRVRELSESPMALCYISEDEDGINGVMCGHRATFWSGKEYFIDEFFISPDCQRMGIGKAMLDYVKKDLLQYDIPTIVLSTEKGFPSEIFYLKNGFVQKESLIFMYNNFA